MSLMVLGIVGGVLAFKAKFNNEFCTAFPRMVGSKQFCTYLGGGAMKCPNLIKNSTITTGGQVLVVCTTTPVDGKEPCPSTLDCRTIAGLKRVK